MAVAPSAPDTVYAAGWIAGPGACAVSTDRGATWTRTPVAPAETVFGIAVHPEDPARVFAAAADGVYRTTDAGATWARLAARRGLRTIALYPGCPDTVLCAGDSGVYVSEDAGSSWLEMNQGLAVRQTRCLEFSNTDGITLFAGTAGGAVFAWDYETGVSAGHSPALRRSLAVQPSVSPGRYVVNLPTGRPTRLSVADAAGRLVLETQAFGRYELDLGDLPDGVYQLAAESGPAITMARLVKLR